MRKAIFLFCVAGLTVQSVSASVYRLKESVPHAGHPAADGLRSGDRPGGQEVSHFKDFGQDTLSSYLKQNYE